MDKFKLPIYQYISCINNSCINNYNRYFYVGQKYDLENWKTAKNPQNRQKSLNRQKSPRLPKTPNRQKLSSPTKTFQQKLL